MQQTGRSRGLSIAAGALTSVQLLAVGGAFLGVGYLLASGAPGLFSVAQRYWGAGGFWDGVFLFFGVVLGVVGLAVFAGLGYLTALLAVAVASILRGGANKLVFAGVINLLVTAGCGVLLVMQLVTDASIIEIVAPLAALAAVSLGAAVCCFAARPRA